MAGRVISFWFPDRLIDELQRRADEAGVSRNAWAAWTLDRAVSTFDVDAGHDDDHAS